VGVVSFGERIVGALVARAGFDATSLHLTAVLNIEDTVARTFWTVAGERPASVAASRTAWTCAGRIRSRRIPPMSGTTRW
jgi:uncharacterized protein